MAKSKPIIKSSTIEKSIETSLSKLDSAYNDCSKAVTALSKQAKKYSKETKRLSKNLATLSKRKKTMAQKYKKESSAQNKKALAAVVKDLSAATNLSPKLKAEKSANTEELVALKSQVKAISAYLKGIKQADKLLSKPKKAKRAKKSKMAVKEAVFENASSAPANVTAIIPASTPNAQSEASF